MTVKERISEFVKYKNISTREFERLSGLNYGYVNSIRVSIQPDKISSIASGFPELNAGWLLTGEGTMLKSESAIMPDHTHSVPLLPIEAVAGFPEEDISGIVYADCDQYMIPEFNLSGCEYVIRVSGSSMYPKYSNGDILACKKVNDVLFFQWGKVYVIDSSQGALVKRVYEDRENPDCILLVSDNRENYPPFSIPKSDIRSLSIVLGVIRME